MGGDDDALVGGDLNDDDVVDIFDFGVFTGQWAVDMGVGDTSCSSTRPHGDISRNRSGHR